MEGPLDRRSAEEKLEHAAFRKEVYFDFGFQVPNDCKELDLLNANPPKLPEKDFFQRFLTMLMKFDNRFELPLNGRPDYLDMPSMA